MRETLRDLAKRLLTLLAVAVVIANLAGLISRQLPDALYLRWNGLEGEVLYTHSVAETASAYILLDETDDTLTFAVVGNDRMLAKRYFRDYTGWGRWTPRFRDVWYASVVDAKTLEPLRHVHVRYNQTATDRVFCTEQDVSTVTHGSLDMDFLNMGVTLEPERLEGLELLFRQQIGEGTVFCFVAEEVRSIVTKEDFRREAELRY